MIEINTEFVELDNIEKDVSNIDKEIDRLNSLLASALIGSAGTNKEEIEELKSKKTTLQQIKDEKMEYGSKLLMKKMVSDLTSEAKERVDKGDAKGGLDIMKGLLDSLKDKGDEE